MWLSDMIDIIVELELSSSTIISIISDNHIDILQLNYQALQLYRLYLITT